MAKQTVKHGSGAWCSTFLETSGGNRRDKTCARCGAPIRGERAVVVAFVVIVVINAVLALGFFVAMSSMGPNL